MNPDASTNPNSLDLPPVMPVERQASNEAPQPVAQSQGMERNPEIVPVAPVGGAPQSVATTPVAPQAPATGIPQPQAQPTPQPQAATPAIADDTDLIEKEWVEKAKEIVAQTREDPYAQNKQLNQMKADYIKKRYAKDVQTGE